MPARADEAGAGRAGQPSSARGAGRGRGSASSPWAARAATGDHRDSDTAAREAHGIDDDERTGPLADHDVDRALKELLEEIRIAQMGGQILLGFLLAVAYTGVLPDGSQDQHRLYAWAVVTTTAAVALLLGIVPLHRMLFGLRARNEILVVGHVLALAGLLALGVGIILGVWLAATFALPDTLVPVVVSSTVLVVGTWVVLPVLVRIRVRRSR
jgi:hypothetical protein